MGLRELFEELQGVRAATQGAAKSAGNLREQLAMQEYSQALPGIIQSGDMGALAGAAANAQDLPTLRSLVANKVKAGEREAPADESYIAAQEAASGLKLPRGLSQAQVDKVISTGQNRKALDVKVDQYQDSESRRSVKQLEDSSMKFKNDLAKIQDEMSDKKIKLKGSLERFLATPSADNARSLGTALARASGQNGVLTEQDVAAYIPRSFQGDARSFLSYLEQSPQAIVSNPELLAHINKNASGMLNDLDNLYNKRLDRHFQDNVKTHRQLLKDKDYRDVIDSKAEELGYDKPEIVDNKIILRRKLNSSGTGPAAGPGKKEAPEGTVSALPQWVDGLSPKTKSILLKQIQGKSPGEAQWDVIRANIKKNFPQERL